MASPERLDSDIRKFEEIGTHPCADYLAIGAAWKEARLVYLRDRWARELLQDDRVRLDTFLAPGMAAGIANVTVDGLEPGLQAEWLWEHHRMIVTPIGHPDCRGLRTSPSVYTTMEELDRFVEAMRQALRTGIA